MFLNSIRQRRMQIIFNKLQLYKVPLTLAERSDLENIDTK